MTLATDTITLTGWDLVVVVAIAFFVAMVVKYWLPPR